MKNEIIGILLATTVGFLFGMIICFVDSKYEHGSDSEAALTSEMIGRYDCYSSNYFAGNLIYLFKI